MLLDPTLLLKAQKLGVDRLYDADFDGDIDNDDVAILAGVKVKGVAAKLGTPEAQAQFAKIEGWATKKGVYRGKSLQWGSGGRSMLLKDRLLCDGYSPQEAEQIVKINYFTKAKQRGIVSATRQGT